MWRLNPPETSAGDAFTTCISIVRNPGLKARLEAATPMVVQSSADYDAAGTAHTLHIIPTSVGVAPGVSTEEMEKVYTQRMVPVDSPGREIYDELFASSKGRCPLCGQRAVATLDHHLPKAHFPALAVAPLNLVPSCSDCNKAKLALVPTNVEEVSLHPYYDDLGEGQWLFAEVLETTPAAARFYVEPIEEWDDVLAQRVLNHFSALKLGALYASEAAEELLNVRHQLASLRESEGSDGVQIELQARAVSSAEGRPNGWRSATYRAWAASEWFCDAGFAGT